MLASTSNNIGEWLNSSGPESDIVVSTRIRLARNVDGFPFNVRANDEQRREIAQAFKDAFARKRQLKHLNFIELKDLPENERHLLVEKHLISKEHASIGGERCVAYSKDESVSIMINEEDHARLQIFRSGLNPDEAWGELSKIDDLLDSEVPFAFTTTFGYLTCCPTNTGTGMRISVLMHLPALSLTKQMQNVFNSLLNIRYSVRGLYGEGSHATGNFFQISNQTTLGKAEEQVIAEVKEIVPEIIKYERSTRERLLVENKLGLQDRVSRATGLLQNSRLIPTEEAIELLSLLRLGLDLGLLNGLDQKTFNELFLQIQPAHLQKTAGKHLPEAERDALRAEIIREKLSKVK